MYLLTLFGAVLLFRPGSCSGVWPPPPQYQCPDVPLFPCKCLGGSDDGVAVLCDNTNLASLAVGLRQFNTKMANLTVSNCNIERLYGDVFRTLDLAKLIIRDTPIREIENDTFLVVGPKILHLEIINSHLETFPVGAVAALENLEYLSFDHSDLTEIPPESFRGLSKLKEIQISNAQVQSPSPNSFVGQKGLKYLRLFRNNITEVKKDLFKFGQSLELLDLAHNRLSKLKPTDFTSLVKMTWLNLTDNGIETFQSNIFRRNPLLAVLHMGYNKIQRLDSSSLRGMRLMRRIYLEYNEIDYIGRQTFQSLMRIGGIYLQGNKLTKLGFQMFGDLRYADSIDISNNLITEVDKNVFEGLYLANINMSYNAIEYLPAETFVNCDNFTVDLSYNKLTNIHEDAFNELSKTFSINVSHNLLTNFSQVPMKHQTIITVIDASYNQIVEIPKNSFPKLYELHTILLHHNKLKTIHRSVFTPLFSLRLLDLSYNSLEEIESADFGKLPTLLDLDLSHNNITRVKRGGLGGLSSVRSVNLNYNVLEEIPSPPISLNHLHMAHNKITEIKGRQPWPVMNSLISIDLDDNLLGDNLEPGKFDNLNTVQNLSLRYNSISKPPWEALQSLQSLRVLHLDGNNLEKLEKSSFGRLPVVSELTLHGNKLNNITYRAFEGLLNLVRLDLSENNLTYIPPGAFATLVALRELDLSHNRLEKLENSTGHGLLDDCLSIRKVDLSYNNIPFVTKKMFPESRWVPYKLEEIDLSYNTIPVLTDNILTGTKHLRYLNISNNIINDIRASVLGNLSSLETLDLSYNSLKDEKLVAERWGDIQPNLTYLSLAHNSLNNIPALHLSQFPSLRTLDLTGNYIIHYYPVFTARVKSGLDIRYEGNLLRCECSLRPVIHWLTTGKRQSSWDKTVCNSPAYLAGRAVSQVLEEQLVCDTRAEAGDFKISPDIQFRNVVEKPSSLALGWYVNTNEDLADFRLELASLTRRNQPLLIKDIGYNTRYDVLDHIPSGEELLLCLKGKTSLGMVRRWRQDQCQEIGPFRSLGTLPPLPSFLLHLLLPLALTRRTSSLQM